MNRQGHVSHAFYMMDRAGDTGVLEASARAKDVVMNVSLEHGPVCLSTLMKLNHLLCVGQYHVVHTHDYKSNVLARLMRARYRYRIVATAHGYNATTRRELLYYGLEKWMFRYVDAVVTPTNEMKKFLFRYGVVAAKLHVIRNGIETAGKTRPAGHRRDGRVKLVYVGRLSSEKDLPNLLEAVAILRKRGVDVEAILAGDGPERERLATMIGRMGLDDCVTMPGYVTDVMGLLCGADVMVNPSRTECMPNSILEAMWANVPVVATNVGGVGEMLDDGLEGLLCRPGDSNALASAIEKLVVDPGYATALAENAGRRMMREFTFEKHIETTVALYRQLLGK
jgi:glycosyltransferase involved in cell wall biosynthesis